MSSPVMWGISGAGHTDRRTPHQPRPADEFCRIHTSAATPDSKFVWGQ